MSTPTEEKLARLIALYDNGASKDARHLLTSLTKAQLAYLLINGDRVEGWHFSPNWRNAFYDWVLRSLEGYL